MNVSLGKIKSRGFGLVEMLIVIIILAILAGMSVLAFGSSSNSTEAAAIMANLDSTKNAMLAYANIHKTRNKDPLTDFVGKASSVILTSSDSLLDGHKGTSSPYFQTIKVRSDDGRMQVGFEGFSASAGVGKALEKKVTNSAGGGYGFSAGSGTYNLWLNISQYKAN
jgi:prepilin-type N-terminal cleavage/methylation domain-containing protein